MFASLWVILNTINIGVYKRALNKGMYTIFISIKAMYLLMSKWTTYTMITKWYDQYIQCSISVYLL